MFLCYIRPHSLGISLPFPTLRHVSARLPTLRGATSTNFPKGVETSRKQSTLSCIRCKPCRQAVAEAPLISSIHRARSPQAGLLEDHAILVKQGRLAQRQHQRIERAQTIGHKGLTTEIKSITIDLHLIQTDRSGNKPLKFCQQSRTVADICHGAGHGLISNPHLHAFGETEGVGRHGLRRIPKLKRQQLSHQTDRRRWCEAGSLQTGSKLAPAPSRSHARTSQKPQAGGRPVRRR